MTIVSICGYLMIIIYFVLSKLSFKLLFVLQLFNVTMLFSSFTNSSSYFVLGLLQMRHLQIKPPNCQRHSVDHLCTIEEVKVPIPGLGEHLVKLLPNQTSPGFRHRHMKLWTAGFPADKTRSSNRQLSKFFDAKIY